MAKQKVEQWKIDLANGVSLQGMELTLTVKLATPVYPFNPPPRPQPAGLAMLGGLDLMNLMSSGGVPAIGIPNLVVNGHSVLPVNADVQQMQQMQQMIQMQQLGGQGGQSQQQQFFMPVGGPGNQNQPVQFQQQLQQQQFF